MKIYEEIKKESIGKKTPVFRLILSPGQDRLELIAVDDDGASVAYIATITRKGLRINEAARCSLEDGGYDSGFTEWDAYGQIEVYKEAN